MARWWHAMQTDVNVNGFISVVLDPKTRRGVMVGPLHPFHGLIPFHLLTTT